MVVSHADQLVNKVSQSTENPISKDKKRNREINVMSVPGLHEHIHVHIHPYATHNKMCPLRVPFVSSITSRPQPCLLVPSSPRLPASSSLSLVAARHSVSRPQMHCYEAI